MLNVWLDRAKLESPCCICTQTSGMESTVQETEPQLKKNTENMLTISFAGKNHNNTTEQLK